MQQKETFDALIKHRDEFNRWFHINVDRQWLFWSLSNANIISICPLQLQHISHSCGPDSSSSCFSSVTKDNFLDHVNNANCMLNLCVWSCQRSYWWEGVTLATLCPKNVSACCDFTVGQNITSVKSMLRAKITLVAWALGKLDRIIKTFKTFLHVGP